MWSRCVFWGCTAALPCRMWPSPATQDTDWDRQTATSNSSLTQGSKVTSERLKTAWYAKSAHFHRYIINLSVCFLLILLMLVRKAQRHIEKTSSTSVIPGFLAVRWEIIFCSVSRLSAWRRDPFWTSGVCLWVWGPPSASSERRSADGRRQLHTPLWLHCWTCVFQLEVPNSRGTQASVQTLDT